MHAGVIGFIYGSLENKTPAFFLFSLIAILQQKLRKGEIIATLLGISKFLTLNSTRFLG